MIRPNPMTSVAELYQSANVIVLMRDPSPGAPFDVFDDFIGDRESLAAQYHDIKLYLNDVAIQEWANASDLTVRFYRVPRDQIESFVNGYQSPAEHVEHETPVRITTVPNVDPEGFTPPYCVLSPSQAIPFRGTA